MGPEAFAGHNVEQAIAINIGQINGVQLAELHTEGAILRLAINNGVLFLFELSTILRADLILSEIGFSNSTGIFNFKKLIVCFSCNWFGVAIITASGFFFANNSFVLL